VSPHIQPAYTKVLELLVAKDIIQDVFGAGSQDIDEMILGKIAELKGMY
jgi:hypothetical protein